MCLERNSVFEESSIRRTTALGFGRAWVITVFPPTIVDEPRSSRENDESRRRMEAENPRGREEQNSLAGRILFHFWGGWRPVGRPRVNTENRCLPRLSIFSRLFVRNRDAAAYRVGARYATAGSRTRHGGRNLTFHHGCGLAQNVAILRNPSTTPGCPDCFSRERRLC